MLGFGAVAITAVAGMLAAALHGSPAKPAPVSPFGGSVAVHIAHVGRIETDLHTGGPGQLQQITCAAAAVAPGPSCYDTR